jgi:hypothetical protein
MNIRKLEIFIGIILVSTLIFSCEKKFEQLDLNKKEVLQSSNLLINPYESECNQFYNFLHSSYSLLKMDSISELEFDSIITNSIYCSVILNLDSADKNVLENYFDDSIVNYKNLILFENNLFNSNSNINKLLKAVAYAKAVFKFYEKDILQDRKNVESFDTCLDKCMHDKLAAIFEKGNIVDQIEYMAGLPYTFLWNLASCSYNCYGNTESNNNQS